MVRRVKWYFNKPTHPVCVDRSVNLHLGCGPVDHPAFINIDLIPYSHVHYLRPIDDLSIFADESVDLIYASHCLEHFSFRKIPTVLAEWSRVLKNDGVIRLSVPDFDAILEIYIDSGKSLDLVLGPIVGGQDYEYNFHHVVFNKSYLAAELEKAGFVDIREWVPNSSDLTTFDDWANEKFLVAGRLIPISLNLEAKKR